MADTYDITVIEEGYRNAVVKIVGVLDTADISKTPAIALTDFNGNDPRLTFKGLRVDCIEYVISDPLVVSLFWNGTSPQIIAALTGSNELEAKHVGGLTPDPLLAGADGAINLTTQGFSAGKVYAFTLKLKLVKLYS